MELTVQQAFEKIDKIDFEKIEKQGYYLNAALCVLRPETTDIHEFIFTFFNPEKNELIQVIVDDNTTAVKTSTQALKPTQKKLNLSKVKLHHDAILKIALEEFKKLNEPFSQIIIALENNEWKVTFITKMLNVFVVHLDTQTGEIKDSHKESLTAIK